MGAIPDHTIHTIQHYASLYTLCTPCQTTLNKSAPYCNIQRDTREVKWKKIVACLQIRERWLGHNTPNSKDEGGGDDDDDEVVDDGDEDDDDN